MTEQAPPRQFTFGPSALATPANAVTVARLLAAPVFVAMIIVWGATWFNVVVGLIVAGSDGLDGYMARRQGTTRSGAFLDPLADKAVVLGLISSREPRLETVDELKRRIEEASRFTPLEQLALCPHCGFATSVDRSSAEAEA